MVYVNSRKQNDTELRRPMHNLHCKKAGKIPSTITPDFYFIVVFFYGGTMMNTYKTAEIAKIIGIHPNTVRLYKKLELIPKPERLANGYRVFTDFHIEQFRIVRLEVVCNKAA